MSDGPGLEPTPADIPAPVPTEPATPTPQQPVPPTDPGLEPKTFDAAYVAKLREEAATHRVRAKELEDAKTAAAQQEQERLDAIAKALGFKTDEPPSAEELTAQLTAAQETARQREQELQNLRVERDVEKLARTHKGDPEALLDSKDFEKALLALDRNDAGFSEALDALVKTTVESNPKYKAAGQAPAVSSAPFSSGPGEQRKRPTSLFEAVRGRTQ